MYTSLNVISPDVHAAERFSAWAGDHASHVPEISVLPTDFDRYPEQMLDTAQLYPDNPLGRSALSEFTVGYVGGRHVLRSLIDQLKPVADEVGERLHDGENIYVATPHFHLMDVVEAASLIKLARDDDIARTAEQYIIPVNKAMAFEAYDGVPILHTMASQGIVVMTVPPTDSVDKYQIPVDAIDKVRRLGASALLRSLKTQTQDGSGRLVFMAPYGKRVDNINSPPQVAEATTKLINRYFSASLSVAIAHLQTGGVNMVVGDLIDKDSEKTPLSERTLRSLSQVAIICSRDS